MADTQTQVIAGDDVLLKAKNIWEKNQKIIIGVLAALVVIVGGWLAYKSLIVAPKEEQAQKALYKAEESFRQDSLKLALQGNASQRGFLYVVNNYGGTESGNLAKYYAGVCYLKTGDFNNAVKYLSDFSTSAKQILMMAYGCLGDAYSELNKNEDAVKYYKKAAETFPEDQGLASEFLFRAALKLELAGKTSEAVDLYKQVKEKYPQTDRGFQADKYIYRLTIPPNDFSVK